MQLHHIDLMYDMKSLQRRLYVDGGLVAEGQTVVVMVPSDGSLYISTAKDLEPASFFIETMRAGRVYDVTLTTEEVAALA